MPPAPKEVGTRSRGGGGAGFAKGLYPPLPFVTRSILSLTELLYTKCWPCEEKRYTSSKYSEVIIFTSRPPQGGEGKVAFRRAEAFLFVCRVGLCYTLGNALGNGLHLVCWLCWGGLEHGLRNLLQEVQTACFPASSNFFMLLTNQAANTFHVWTCDLSPHPFHQITVFLWIY